MKVIYILCLRQIKRYLRARARMIGSLGQPLLFLLAMGFGFGPIFQKAGGGNYIQFLAPGIVIMGILFTAVFSGIEVIWDRQFGFLKETLVAPVSRLHIALGRTLGGAVVAFIQGLVVLGICLLVGFRIEAIAWLPIALLVMFISAVLFAAIGTAIGSVLEDMQAFPLIMNFLVMPLFFLSGALFPMKGLPRPLILAMEWNPVTYAVNGLRGAFAHSPLTGVGGDLVVLLVVTGALVSLSAYLFSRIEL
ncbi:MAG TPA: ABC transporter permease [Acidiferrobacter sp.]|nr:ABC transporter permease [Acidiferrobacter sp.]